MVKEKTIANANEVPGEIKFDKRQAWQWQIP